MPYTCISLLWPEAVLAHFSHHLRAMLNFTLISRLFAVDTYTPWTLNQSGWQLHRIMRPSHTHDAHHLRVQGEPKSGTALMYHGSQGALMHTCNFLKRWFGSGSCHLEGEDYQGQHHTPPNIGLTFDPRLSESDAKCPCHGVDR